MHRRARDRAAAVRVWRPVRAVSQLAFDLPRAWPNDRVLLPRQWHAALGYVLTVPHHTPDGRPVDTYSVSRDAADRKAAEEYEAFAARRRAHAEAEGEAEMRQLEETAKTLPVRKKARAPKTGER